MSDMAYLLQKVTKRYNGRDILAIEDLTIRQGEILAVVGPSGAGKTTLLRLLNFLEAPSSGSIHFGGACIGCDGDAPLHLRRRVTTVFQRPILLKRSVWANVAYGLQLRRCRDVDDRVRGALARVGLLSLARQKAGTLSGGEAQRVALARAIVLEPEVLLLDEPTANLDPYNVGLIEDIVRSLNAEQGTTIVLVTHNVFQARRLAHRVGLLLNGSLIEEAPVEAFFASPCDSRTLAFVEGKMVY